MNLLIQKQKFEVPRQSYNLGELAEYITKNKLEPIESEIVGNLQVEVENIINEFLKVIQEYRENYIGNIILIDKVQTKVISLVNIETGEYMAIAAQQMPEGKQGDIFLWLQL